MTFFCPVCKQTHPLDIGQLVMDTQKPLVHRKGFFGAPELPAVPEQILVVILCPPCAADLVLVRAGVR